MGVCRPGRKEEARLEEGGQAIYIYIYIYIYFYFIYMLLCIYIYIYREREMYRDMYIYIYIYIEREREREICVCIYIYIYMHIYIYIYIYYTYIMLCSPRGRRSGRGTRTSFRGAVFKRLLAFGSRLDEGPRAIVRRGRKKNSPRGLHRVRSDTRAPRTLGYLRGGEGTAD